MPRKKKTVVPVEKTEPKTSPNFDDQIVPFSSISDLDQELVNPAELAQIMGGQIELCREAIKMEKDEEKKAILSELLDACTVVRAKSLKLLGFECIKQMIIMEDFERSFDDPEDEEHELPF